MQDAGLHPAVHHGSSTWDSALHLPCLSAYHWCLQATVPAATWRHWRGSQLPLLTARCVRGQGPAVHVRGQLFHPLLMASR
jgi:hypothetical protein